MYKPHIASNSTSNLTSQFNPTTLSSSCSIPFLVIQLVLFWQPRHYLSRITWKFPIASQCPVLCSPTMLVSLCIVQSADSSLAAFVVYLTQAACIYNTNVSVFGFVKKHGYWYVCFDITADTSHITHSVLHQQRIHYNYPWIYLLHTSGRI